QYVENNPKLEAEYPKNVQVDELPEFNKVGKEAYRMLEKTAKYVLRALALHLGLEETYFDDYILNGNSILRPIHYPPITQEPKEAVRAAAHGDINLITLLMGAQGKGLQVQNHKGEWIDAIAQPDELMINVGDMLSRHTNNKLKSTIHRVINPPKELWGTSRYSIPFFMHPISDMKLNVLENCIDESNPKQYEDITAGEFLTERLIELGLIKK
ncbi:MAG TPA: 2OG-Fe(II) oxygenase family protein, partial [Flavobacteriaceae bacterium]|nr:2OG-Fe(II) oxygenase family protein [Flavobacteriaceae bacterium]